ncbi:hypothetical protein PAXRUDRAFT_15287 [Paxillus rubicundulus Ve08.2h10]|uniref:Uncharacterized protein n=1 Tax=Paxillus rubicundulus Ve08.2h10 TaxID=930991 RepID=A0A0D0DB86_9AGAM|nr:hypothetical protein PAXRUDRAFT_15287 [Paxillus rubicundulus Ve08.2h10]
MKVQKEVECQRAEEEMRQKVEEEARQNVEEEAKQKAEVEAWRRVETKVKVKVKVCTEEVMQAQSLVLGPSKGKQPKVAASGVAEQAGGLAPCYGCSGAGVMQAAGGHAVNMVEEAGGGDVTMGWEEEGVDTESKEAEEEHDTLGVLTEILAAVVTEMRDMAMDRRCVTVESHAQTERMLGILEEIWGCLDLEFTPEEEFNKEEVAEVAEEREALKGWSEEEVEVDESV